MLFMSCKFIVFLFIRSFAFHFRQVNAGNTNNIWRYQYNFRYCINSDLLHKVYSLFYTIIQKQKLANLQPSKYFTIKHILSHMSKFVNKLSSYSFNQPTSVNQKSYGKQGLNPNTNKSSFNSSCNNKHHPQTSIYQNNFQYNGNISSPQTPTARFTNAKSKLQSLSLSLKACKDNQTQSKKQWSSSQYQSPTSSIFQSHKSNLVITKNSSNSKQASNQKQQQIPRNSYLSNSKQNNVGYKFDAGNKNSHCDLISSKAQNNYSSFDIQKIQQLFAKNKNKIDLTTTKKSDIKTIHRDKQNSTFQPYGHQDNRKQPFDFIADQSQRQFMKKCCEMYNLPSNNQQNSHVSQLSQKAIVQNVLNQINKRDQIYELVKNQIVQKSQHKQIKSQKSPLQTQNTSSEVDINPQLMVKSFYEQDALMQEIIHQFKSMSGLKIDDLNQLYYFLKWQGQQSQNHDSIISS